MRHVLSWLLATLGILAVLALCAGAMFVALYPFRNLSGDNFFERLLLAGAAFGALFGVLWLIAKLTKQRL